MNNYSKNTVLIKTRLGISKQILSLQIVHND